MLATSFKTLARTVATATLIAGFGTSLASAQSWDMPTPYPEGTFHTQNVMEFAKDVEEATNGDVSITVHPGGSLVKHPEIKNAVRSGQAQIGEFLMSTLANENALFEVDAVPFVATSYEASGKLWDTAKDEIADLLAQQNLTLLYAVPWPPQGLYANKPIETIDDLKGLKFRAYNRATERIAQLAGAVPTQVEVPDIPQAFATGRVDAMITSSSTGANSKAWDYLTHFYDTKAWLPRNVIVVNTETFDALDEETKTAIKEAAAAAEERGLKMSMEEHEAQMKVLSDNGVEVGEPSEALASSMQEIGKTMASEWSDRAGEEGAAILEEYRN